MSYYDGMEELGGLAKKRGGLERKTGKGRHGRLVRTRQDRVLGKHP